MAEQRLEVTRTHLSDGSEVYSVRLRIVHGEIDAVSEADALALAEKIVAAIEAHSNDTAYFVERTAS